MSTSFSLGVVIGAAVSGSFASAMGNTQRTLNKLTDTTSRLKAHQDDLSRRTERYGQIGAGVADRLRGSYDSVGESLKRLETHQERLLKWDTKVNNMLLKRQQTMGQLRGVIGATTAAITLGYKTSSQYAGEESILRSISQGSRNYDKGTEKQLLDQARANSRKTSQSVADLLSSTDELVDAGWDVKAAANLGDVFGKVSTLYGLQVRDTAKIADVLVHNLGYDNDQGTRHALNLLADSGNQVGFEFNSVAPHFGQLAESFEKRGIVGDEAITEIMSALGAARKTMRNKDDVVSGLQGWMNTSDGRKMENRFEVMGVDYVRSRADYMKNGMSDFEASLRVTQRYLEEVGSGKFMQKFTALNGNAEAQSQLIQSFGMGQIFSSPEQIKFINAMSKNWGTYEKNKDNIKNHGDANYINMAYDQKSDTLGIQGQQLKNELSTLSSTFGEVMAPVIRDNIDQLKTGIHFVTDWISRNKELVQTYGGMAITAGKYFLLLRGGWLMSKLLYSSTLGWIFSVARSGVGLVTRIATLITEYRTLGKSSSRLFNLTFKTARGFASLLGKLRGLGPWVSRLASGAGALGKILGGGLLQGLRVAGQAVLWIGRALMLNPIGLIITGIAVAAYLIYEYWEPIKGFFTSLWTDIKAIGTRVWDAITGFFTDRWQDIQTAFEGGLLGIGELIVNWSPLGLFYKAFAGVMSWFGVDLPGNFTDFGTKIMAGLMSGLAPYWAPVKGFFTSLWSDIKSVSTRVWDAITGFFTDRWQDIQTAFDGGLLGVGELIVNWSPLGLFHKAFSGVMNWFGVDLPDNFTDFGKNILDGLVNGIKEKWQSVKDTFGELTDGIKSFFTGEVKIKSPSRVFMGYGNYIVEGLRLGIRNTAWKAEQAARLLASKIQPDSLRSPRIPAVPFIADLPAGATASGGAAHTDIHLTYSPVIHIRANPAEASVADVLKTALRENLPELERLLDEVLRRKQRRSFDA